MSDGDRAILDDFLAEMRREFPSFRVIDKRDSPLSKAIDVVLRAITLGGQKTFMTQYYTVIGDRLYVPEGWESTDPVSAVITLRHERVHLRQRRRFTLPGMAFIYLVPLFPLGLAWGRARIEWEAYEETIRATWELRSEARARLLRKHIVDRFVSADYGWMWPFRKHVEGWFDDAIERIAQEHEAAAG